MATLTGAYELIVEYADSYNPNQTWRNTYVFHSDTVPASDTGIAAALQAYTILLIHPDANQVKVSCYNWARGRQPYPDGVPLWTITESASGGADAVWSHLASPYTPNGGEVCLRIDHEPTNPGKPGRNFIRALLGKDDVSATSGGRWTLVPTVSNLQSNLNTALSSSGLHSFLGEGTGGQWLLLVRYHKASDTVVGTSTVTGFSVIDATTNKQTRKNKK